MERADMEAGNVQAQLQSAYADWKKTLRFTPEQAATLSPPLLLSVPAGHTVAERRIWFLGQETAGWDWTRDLRVKYPQYEQDYPYQNVVDLQDFMKNNDSVEALCWGYQQFDFASKHPRIRASPFWRAFREVQGWSGANLVWNDLSRCDFESASILRAPKNVRSSLSNSQRELIAEELRILEPHACLFFTGPYYDELLSAVFPGCEYAACSVVPVRKLARVIHPSLPRSSFRTYHPGYINRSGQRDLIARLHDLIFADT